MIHITITYPYKASSKIMFLCMNNHPLFKKRSSTTVNFLRFSHEAIKILITNQKLPEYVYIYILNT